MKFWYHRFLTLDIAFRELFFAVIVVFRSKCVLSEFLQQKAIKNSASVIYPSKRLVVICRLWGRGRGGVYLSPVGEGEGC